MELKGKDTYKIEMNHELTKSMFQSLMLCYQACIGSTAVSLYLTLAMEAVGQRSFESHQRLCAIMGIDIIALQMAREKCEEVNLLSTWHQPSDSKDNYVYVLNPVLSIEQFLSHDVLGRRYMQIAGAKNSEITQSRILYNAFDKKDYSNVSKRFDPSVLNSWNKDDEIKFNRVKPAYRFNKNKNTHIEFDYDTFLSQSSNLTFPIEARTQEALEVIGELATVYGISADRMRILVGHSINNSTNVLNIQKLKNLASYEKPKEKKSKNPYDISPAQFLMNLQNGAPITTADGRLLEYLISTMKMKQEVVNVLIEMILKHHDNRLSRSYVEKVASTWVRNQVDTLEKALEAAKQTTDYPARRSLKNTTVLPKDFEENKERKTSSEEITDEEIKALRERMKRLEG